MRKILDRVTITGADDYTSTVDMAFMSDRFPWVEWGILLSKNSLGSPRFPSLQWMENLYQARELFERNDIPFSGHLCGSWVREVCNGEWRFVEELKSVYRMFSRYQLNFHSYIHKIKDKEAFVKGFQSVHPWARQFVFQLDDVNNDIVDVALKAKIDAQPFFDLSGGIGRLPDKWEKAREGVYTGYAGGLSPENVHDQLIEIEKVCGDGPIWIDVETMVRTPTPKTQHLDMNKVEKFLQAVEPWVRDDWETVRLSFKPGGNNAT